VRFVGIVINIINKNKGELKIRVIFDPHFALEKLKKHYYFSANLLFLEGERDLVGSFKRVPKR